MVCGQLKLLAVLQIAVKGPAVVSLMKTVQAFQLQQLRRVKKFPAEMVAR